MQRMYNKTICLPLALHSVLLMKLKNDVGPKWKEDTFNKGTTRRFF